MTTMNRRAQLATLLSTLLLTMCYPRCGMAFVTMLRFPKATNTASFPQNHHRCSTSYTCSSPSVSNRARLGRRCSTGGDSPFDTSEYSEEDATRREAEELEQMIRGSRGIVMEIVEREWKEALDRAMENEGERLCAEAYEGYASRGRGCIFVNVDMGLSSSSKGHKDDTACHAVFRSLEEVVVERSSRVKPNDQMQIIQRCQEYDPERSFVLVFGHKGMLGVQVMRPSRPPRQVFQTRRTMRD